MKLGDRGKGTWSQSSFFLDLVLQHRLQAQTDEENDKFVVGVWSEFQICR